MTIQNCKEKINKCKKDRKLYIVLLIIEAIVLLVIFPDVTKNVPGVGEFLAALNKSFDLGFEEWALSAGTAEFFDWLGQQLGELVWPAWAYALCLPVSVAVNEAAAVRARLKLKNLQKKESGIPPAAGSGRKRSAARSSGKRFGFSALMPFTRRIQAALLFAALKRRGKGDNSMFDRTYLRVQKLTFGANDRRKEHVYDWDGSGQILIYSNEEDTSAGMIRFFLQNGKAYIDAGKPIPLTKNKALILRKNDVDRNDPAKDTLVYAVTWFGGKTNG